MSSLIDKGKVADKISDLFLDKYEAKANSDLTEFYKEVLKILINEKGQSNWTSVKDRLPEKSVPVLICANGHRVTAYYDKVKEVFRLTEDENLYYLTEYVTHWMPLPTPPESEDDAENSCMKEASEGEWIIHFDDLFPEESTQECSICHAEQYLRYGDDDNYCPNCGAKMKQMGKG